MIVRVYVREHERAIDAAGGCVVDNVIAGNPKSEIIVSYHSKVKPDAIITPTTDELAGLDAQTKRLFLSERGVYPSVTTEQVIANLTRGNIPLDEVKPEEDLSDFAQEGKPPALPNTRADNGDHTKSWRSRLESSKPVASKKDDKPSGGVSDRDIRVKPAFKAEDDDDAE